MPVLRAPSAGAVRVAASRDAAGRKRSLIEQILENSRQRIKLIDTRGG
jgi:hypothetical protein